jgi:Holliday junction DNA helicase RuvA
MLAFLRGTILYKSATFVILEHDGIGYQIFLASRELEKAQVGKPAEFYTFEYVREERRELYGFKSAEGLEFFFMLIEVQGVGPRLAQKIMGFAPINEIKQAVISNNSSFLSNIPRLGAKIAGKLILELKPKLTHTKASRSAGSYDPDLEEALKRLGYSFEEIQGALAKFPSETKLSPEEKIKAALRLLKRDDKGG